MAYTALGPAAGGLDQLRAAMIQRRMMERSGPGRAIVIRRDDPPHRGPSGDTRDRMLRAFYQGLKQDRRASQLARDIGYEGIASSRAQRDRDAKTQRSVERDASMRSGLLAEEFRQKVMDSLSSRSSQEQELGLKRQGMEMEHGFREQDLAERIRASKAQEDLARMGMSAGTKMDLKDRLAALALRDNPNATVTESEMAARAMGGQYVPNVANVSATVRTFYPQIIQMVKTGDVSGLKGWVAQNLPGVEPRQLMGALVEVMNSPESESDDLRSMFIPYDPARGFTKYSDLQKGAKERIIRELLTASYGNKYLPQAR